MGKPAARVTDMHICPMFEGPKPHVGGPILPVSACSSVIICGMPAATIGTKATCIGPLDTITQGSNTVLIGNKPAARQFDRTAHSGLIVTGCLTVLIGESNASPPKPCAIEAENAAAMAIVTKGASGGLKYIREKILR